MLFKHLRYSFVLILVLTFNAQAVNDKLSDYALGAGDKIQITVFDEPDLSIQVVLSDAGTILYPLLGEIQIHDTSISQLAENITAGLKDGYMVAPDVSVSVIEYRRFFIYGEVSEPGGYPFIPGLTLQQAVALAGGFTDRASPSKMYVSPEGSDDKKTKNKLSLKSPVNPGDTITIDDGLF